MIRLILILFFGIFVAVGVFAISLYHFFGVDGLIAFPFVMLVFLWVAKWLIRGLLKRFALSLFGMKARALRGATMNVHSIKAVPKPEPDGDEDEDEDEVENENEDEDLPLLKLRRASEKKVENAGTREQPVAVESLQEEDLRDYVELDVTITPKPAGDLVWEPGELMLASEKISSLADLEKKSIGAAYTVKVWDGSAFGPDDEGKYTGEQRLKIVFELKPGTKSGWLCYYHEAIGQLELPVGTVEV